MKICNQCAHFDIVGVGAKNIRERAIFVCNHPDSGRLLVRIVKKFHGCPKNGNEIRREIASMMEILGDSDPEKIAWAKKYENQSRLPEAWQRLKERVDAIEIIRPGWCFENERVF